mmetsp:Transcript_86617/g.229559  ORF Transcript_86617/g.229559 Transcript_86617/m.229559 type:complete len:355 (+) Transcript_86617:510-1574(+)
MAVWVGAAHLENPSGNPPCRWWRAAQCLHGQRRGDHLASRLDDGRAGTRHARIQVRLLAEGPAERSDAHAQRREPQGGPGEAAPRRLDWAAAGRRDALLRGDVPRRWPSGRHARQARGGGAGRGPRRLAEGAGRHGRRRAAPTGQQPRDPYGAARLREGPRGLQGRAREQDRDHVAHQPADGCRVLAPGSRVRARRVRRLRHGLARRRAEHPVVLRLRAPQDGPRLPPDPADVRLHLLPGWRGAQPARDPLRRCALRGAARTAGLGRLRGHQQRGDPLRLAEGPGQLRLGAALGGRCAGQGLYGPRPRRGVRHGQVVRARRSCSRLGPAFFRVLLALGEEKQHEHKLSCRCFVL